MLAALSGTPLPFFFLKRNVLGNDAGQAKKARRKPAALRER
jgi:hypothetical protein